MAEGDSTILNRKVTVTLDGAETKYSVLIQYEGVIKGKPTAGVQELTDIPVTGHVNAAALDALDDAQTAAWDAL